MKIPKPRKLAHGYAIYLRLDGVLLPPIKAETEKECRREAARIKAEYQARTQEKKLDKGNLTLKQACEQYIAKREKALSPSTIRGYDIITRNRFQTVMDQPVKKINNWQELYDDELSRLTPKTMMNTWGFIKSVCREECEIDLPKLKTDQFLPKERLFLDQDQVKVFVKAVKGQKCEIPALLALSSLRESEIRGLDWSRVDLKNNRIQVRGSVVRDKNNQLVEKSKNKTASSQRWVPIFIPELREALEDVEDKSGKIISCAPNTLYRQINAVCDKAGLPAVGVHGLRHSFASLAYSLGVPIKIAMQLGGWSDYNTMLKIYTHLAQKDIGKYTVEISDFFKSQKKMQQKMQRMLKKC